ncbi:DUF4396 domain-containing protein [Saccharophagus degradans]|uniref:DUF4396 domain-containing protein n=1 Tax=Saccharophagus degradans TaxID=86304 RepID=UPI002477F844|nr:DUF4396 domain-containing protein [Saccharophagus degradans]WGO98622.1 DUF4396 domain-containing protein [Saccharophagus degradans]
MATQHLGATAPCCNKNTQPSGGFWRDKKVWQRSAYNTGWCLLGCAIGDFGTILAFQLWSPTTPAMLVMGLAMMNGLLTSIMLETLLLCRSMTWGIAFKTAIAMSLVSMIAMELAMNLTDYALVGAAALTWWSVLPSLAAGFIAPWPYNYWRLKKYGKACH